MPTRATFLTFLLVAFTCVGAAGAAWAEPSTVANSAGATSGDVSRVTFFPDSMPNGTPYLASVQAARLPAGGYLAFRDTREFKKSGARRFLLGVRVASIRRYESSGKPIAWFDRSEIGKGLKLARSGETLEMRGIVPYTGSIYIAWVTNPGSNDSKSFWPRSYLIAFSANSGKLVRNFGSNGVLRYGDDANRVYETGRSRSYGFKLLTDGRMVTCGNLSGIDNLNLFRPFATISSLNSKSAEPFFATHSFSESLRPSESGYYEKNCLIVSQDAAGRVILGGSIKDWGGKEYCLWLAAYYPDGTRDSTFGDDGQVYLRPELPSDIEHHIFMRSIVASPDGKIYVAGDAFARTFKGFVARLESNGSFDSSFGNSGFKRVSAFTPTEVWPSADKLMMSGFDPDRATPAIGRLLDTGRWDTSLNRKGWRTYAGSRSDDGVYRIPGGKENELWGWMYPFKKSKEVDRAAVTVNPN